MADDTSHLPLEIIEIILSKLSAKPLLRFKSVCKSWNTVISDPVFVRNHHRRQQRSKDSSSQNLFLLKTSKVTFHSFSLIKLEELGRKIQTLQVIDGPFLSGTTPLCFCEGLILVTGNSHKRLSLWNPSTRKHAELQPPFNYSQACFGLCHDPITDDFKVVVVDWRWYSVYSCKNKYWMILGKQFPETEYIRFGVSHDPGVSVDGASYWVSRITPQLAYYDPRDDEFKSLHKPENVYDREWINLVGLRGLLCLYSEGRDEKTIVIWTKGKGIDNHSWNKFVTISNLESPVHWFEPQCLVGNKIVIRIKETTYDGRLVLYSPSKKRFEEFEDTMRVCFLGLVPYMDTLFFPH